ncbi:MAG: hypothetical protein Q4G14_06775 [Paracoccus sp. (in: a-proteobacteria)]|uniref:hypothetical protein n=1 Tax=Paracoccus sp. TaxID=267 RepID=UPI0026DF3D59|nr:hypothetical protein [Paracoccus sp. (in: a-proteobacteria)]MDO5612931.1 hypothetical protein [Paracoccus sp. (in: a-proteobacteria)]
MACIQKNQRPLTEEQFLDLMRNEIKQAVKEAVSEALESPVEKSHGFAGSGVRLVDSFA